MVVALATGAMPAAVAGALAAMAMVVLGVLRTEEAYRAVSWTAVVLIAGLIPVSTALQDTGAADKIASVLLDVVGDAGPHALLVGLVRRRRRFQRRRQQHGHRAHPHPRRRLGRRTRSTSRHGRSS